MNGSNLFVASVGSMYRTWGVGGLTTSAEKVASLDCFHVADDKTTESCLDYDSRGTDGWNSDHHTHDDHDGDTRPADCCLDQDFC
eukprot:scaffold37445_cov46-Attheya_sp.AAC.2